MVEERRDAELTEFEEGLATLVPKVIGVDRDQLLFLAGRQSVVGLGRCRWVWPASTALSTLAAAVLAVMLWVDGIGVQDFAENPPPEDVQQPIKPSPANVSETPDEEDDALLIALKVSKPYGK